MTVVNYIDESERIFREPVAFAQLSDLWRAEGGLSLSPSTTVYQDSEYGSLLANGDISGSVYFNDWLNPATDIPSQFSVSGATDLNDDIVSFVWVRATKNCVLRMRNIRTVATYNTATGNYELSTDANDRVVGEWGTLHYLLGVQDEPTWKLLRARMLALTDDGNDVRYAMGFEIEIVFDSVAGDVNISRPTITMLGDAFENEFLLECVPLLPNLLLENDFADPTTNSVQFPLIRLFDVMTHSLTKVQETLKSFIYRNESQGFEESEIETYNALISPILIDRLDQLKWLAQFRGRELIVTFEPSTEGEEWTEFVLDSATSGVLDSTSVIATSETSVGGLSGGVAAFFKWQVENGYYGHNAGTITAMVEAIKLLLDGDKTVNYTVGVNTVAFQTKIGQTYGSSGLSVGQSNPNVLLVLEPARPLGLIVTHELIS